MPYRVHGWRVPRARRDEAGKALVPLLSVLVVLAMGVAGVAVYLQMQERDRRQAKERELHLAVAENDDLKIRLQELQQAKSRVEEDVARAQQQLVASEAELAKSLEAQQVLSRSIEDREREIGRLTKEMDQIRSERDQISTKLSDLQSEREAVQRQVAELEKAKGELEAKVMELSDSQPLVELEKVRVSGESAPAAAEAVVPAGTSLGPSQGQVVVVNREYDFIVMNLGRNQGLSVGQEFHIVRGEEILGRVKVEKVYDELSAAAILPESRKDQIREGDTVKSI